MIINNSSYIFYTFDSISFSETSLTNSWFNLKVIKYTFAVSIYICHFRTTYYATTIICSECTRYTCTSSSCRVVYCVVVTGDTLIVYFYCVVDAFTDQVLRTKYGVRSTFYALV